MISWRPFVLAKGDVAMEAEATGDQETEAVVVETMVGRPMLKKSRRPPGRPIWQLVCASNTETAAPGATKCGGSQQSTLQYLTDQFSGRRFRVDTEVSYSFFPHQPSARAEGPLLTLIQLGSGKSVKYWGRFCFDLAS